MKLLLLCACSLLTAHGFHSSLATLDYVTKSHALQAVVVANAGDLETALRLQTGRAIELDRTGDAEALTRAYVQKSIGLRAAGRDIPFHWVGMEVKATFVYFYIEAEIDTVTGLEIRNSLLTDLLPDQVNMVSIKRDGKGKPFDCLFGQGSSFTKVAFAD